MVRKCRLDSSLDPYPEKDRSIADQHATDGEAMYDYIRNYKVPTVALIERHREGGRVTRQRSTRRWRSRSSRGLDRGRRNFPSAIFAGM